MIDGGRDGKVAVQAGRKRQTRDHSAGDCGGHSQSLYTTEDVRDCGFAEVCQPRCCLLEIPGTLYKAPEAKALASGGDRLKGVGPGHISNQEHFLRFSMFRENWNFRRTKPFFVFFPKNAKCIWAG